ncbi:MAG: NAD-dependent epimerase/dehydratase family protein [Chloroflexi bacterium]|nr:MAG: NAD-dependent epimerase/dehydratase family protein [Chloroflexota bacterium]
MSPKRILLTGAAGFVGAVLGRRLLEAGHEVHVILRGGSASWRLADVVHDLRIHHADLTDEARVQALVGTIRPEVIYHLATHGAYPFQTNADGIIQTNILGTWNLLKASARVDYEVFVNTGSSSEYGFKEYAMRETDLLEPNSYYAVAKGAQTLLCQHVAKAEQRPITTFRLFSVYGPFEEPSRLIPTLVRLCLEGRNLTLVDPETARDFVYIDDVVDAYLRIDKLAGLCGEVMNVGTGVQRTLAQVVDAVLRETGAQVQCDWGAMPARIWDSKTWVADCTKSRRLLGWHSTTSFGDGIARTVDWMRQRRDARGVA